MPEPFNSGGLFAVAKRTITPGKIGGALTRLVNEAQGRGEANANKIYRAAIIELFNRIVLRTPVDTGRLRGNWMITLNAPTKRKLNKFEKGGRGQYAESKIPKKPFCSSPIILKKLFCWGQGSVCWEPIPEGF